jgi:hypothetical protein
LNILHYFNSYNRYQFYEQLEIYNKRSFESMLFRCGEAINGATQQ